MASLLAARLCTSSRLKPVFAHLARANILSTLLVGGHDHVRNITSHVALDAWAGRKDVRLPFAVKTPIRSFSSDISALPQVTDLDVKNALKDVLATDWGELPEPVQADVMNALSKESDDKAGQEALANAWRAAEAVEQFSGVLESLRMELDDLTGHTGENVRPLPEEIQGALRAAYKRYSNYLEAFGPDETYLRKKVETELGRHMIYIKMRCSGLDAEWGKVTLLGTSGLSGSYIEQRG
jgi:hypothetical protein